MLKGNHVVCPSTLNKRWRDGISSWSRCHSGRHISSATNHAGKADLTAPSKLLPVSPLLDAVCQEARAKASFRLPKPVPKAADVTDFQKRLAANPYAHALATPVRQCSASHIRLPSHFLVGITVEFRPKPDNPATTVLSIASLPNEKTALGPRSYLLNSRSAVQTAMKAKAWKRLVSVEMQDRFRVNSRKSKEWLRPEGLDDDMLHHLRQSVYAKMKWAFSTPNAGLIIMPNAPGEKSGNAACILHLKPADNLVLSNYPPLPTYHLHTLLGEGLLNELLQDSKFASAEAVMLADSHLTTVLRTRLLKLQAYLDYPLQ